MLNFGLKHFLLQLDFFYTAMYYVHLACLCLCVLYHPTKKMHKPILEAARNMSRKPFYKARWNSSSLMLQTGHLPVLAKAQSGHTTGTVKEGEETGKTMLSLPNPSGKHSSQIHHAGRGCEATRSGWPHASSPAPSF